MLREKQLYYLAGRKMHSSLLLLDNWLGSLTDFASALKLTKPVAYANSIIFQSFLFNRYSITNTFFKEGLHLNPFLRNSMQVGKGDYGIPIKRISD